MGQTEEIAKECWKVTSFECKKCGFNCDWPGQLETHMFTVHGISVDLEEYE